MTLIQTCQTHTNRPADYTCALCKRPTCEECLRARKDGTLVCSMCEERAAAALAAALRAEDDGYDLAPSAPSSPLPPPRQASIHKCVEHPEMDATARCGQCGKLICTTCDFAFPGNVHLCPACATDTKQGLPPPRKAQAYWSLGLGAFNVLGTVGLFLLGPLVRGQLDKDAMMLMNCSLVLMGVLALVGFGVGVSAFRRKSYNPGIVWVGPVLNGLIIALWVGLIGLNIIRK